MRDELLAAKAAQIQQSLSTWAELERILGPGERIVFSIHIEIVPTVVEDRDQKSLLEMFTEDFFTQERFSKLEGIPPHMATRARSCALYGAWSITDSKKIKDCSVALFLEEYSNSSRLLRIPSLGQKTLPWIVRAIQEAGIPYK